MKTKNLYKKVAVESGVASAGPHKLILMLFDGCESSLLSASRCMRLGDKLAAGAHIGKAISIINNGLRASLDMSQGEISESLDDLYHFCGARLTLANLRQDPSILDNVLSILMELRGAWAEIGSAQAA